MSAARRRTSTSILAEALDWTASFTLLSGFAVLGAVLYLSLRSREKQIVRA